MVNKMEEPLGSCSYPGCPEPAVIMAGVHRLNAAGESVETPAEPVCPEHFFLLWKMATDPKFRRATIEALDAALNNPATTYPKTIVIPIGE